MDVFRAVDPTSELGRAFIQYSSKGQLVPDDITVALWSSQIDAMESAGRFSPEHDFLILERGQGVGGTWRERLNSDAREYWGSGLGNFGAIEAAPLPSHGHFHSLSLRLPPLAVLVLTPG